MQKVAKHVEQELESLISEHELAADAEDWSYIADIVVPAMASLMFNEIDIDVKTFPTKLGTHLHLYVVSRDPDYPTRWGHSRHHEYAWDAFWGELRSCIRVMAEAWLGIED